MCIKLCLSKFSWLLKCLSHSSHLNFDFFPDFFLDLLRGGSESSIVTDCWFHRLLFTVFHRRVKIVMDSDHDTWKSKWCIITIVHSHIISSISYLCMACIWICLREEFHNRYQEQLVVYSNQYRSTHKVYNYYPCVSILPVYSLYVELNMQRHISHVVYGSM